MSASDPGPGGASARTAAGAGTVARPRTIAEQFARVESAYGDRRALRAATAGAEPVAEGQEASGWLTFAEVAELAGAAVAHLAGQGAVAGDRIVLALPNSVVLRVLDRAVLGAGLVRVALSPRLHAREIAGIAADCGARVVCCGPEAAAGIRTALAAVGSAATVTACSDRSGRSAGSPRPSGTAPRPGRPDAALSPASLAEQARAPLPVWPAPAPSDTAMLMYSSGTTGRPKGAVVTHAAWVAQTDRALGELPSVGPGDVVLAVAPMSHFGGSIGLDCAVSGAATVTMARFDPRTVLEAVAAYGVTVIPLAPIMLERVARAAGGPLASLRGVRAVPYGGSPIGADSLALAERVFPGVLTQFYGLAEALAPLTVLSPADHASGVPERLGSAGRAVGGVELRLVGEEIVVRCDTVMAGYWNRPELTAEAVHDGWFRTGDLARVDADGYVHLTGRSSELIVTGGFNVQPAEVERVVAEVPGVSEVAVVGLPHPVWGEGITAAVVLDGGPATGTPGEGVLAGIAHACAAALAGYKKPVAVHAVPEIPRNPAGKIDRRTLRQLLSDREEH
ncbi:class I adenylate-forming enzyme family protein [Streptomyces iconiensis]|uniref:Class I adenylate-forming enzyme family protein n=1 Tax=Streptomyces iconiensis TaxID=1384038 RepID=A0ABT7A4R0_9ACTN|nr:class I adenylate-forming enzyme family protein [Streptomyces iconiensis]MDJ1136342.1 class I adenylate-forming enzyme family protein [Streptomyces iconiensis]